MRLMLTLVFTLTAALLAAAGEAQITDTAEYTVRFVSTWSAETHPVQIPERAHLSPLIGGVHGPDVELWRPAGMATTGIKDMAERGRTSPLDLEVQQAIDLGLASSIVRGGGISQSPGTAETSFTVSREFPRLSLVSMLAPSPDWFVGVNGLDLFVGGDWLQEKVVTLYPWDAGTDSGVTYESPNDPTLPAEPIHRITTLPVGNGVPVGTFVITRTDSARPDALLLDGGRFAVSAEWQTFGGDRGRARAKTLTDRSGYFWFFKPNNVEVVVKVLDGCASTGHFWVFAGGLTNLGVDLRVEDTETGEVRTYSNTLGDPFQPVVDLEAFATCP